MEDPVGMAQRKERVERSVSVRDLQWRRRREEALKAFALSDMICVSEGFVKGKIRVRVTLGLGLN